MSRTIIKADAKRNVIQASPLVNSSKDLNGFNENQIVLVRNLNVATSITTLYQNNLATVSPIIPLNNSISMPKNVIVHSKKIVFKNSFSVEEDSLLLHLVNSFGENDWLKISNYMKRMNYNRNIRQCRERYYHYLNPNINNSEWTKNEDELLLKKVEENGKRWKKFENFSLEELKFL